MQSNQYLEYCIFRLHPSSGILQDTKEHVSEIGPALLPLLVRVKFPKLCSFRISDDGHSPKIQQS
jgi:hypothetical protein